MKCNQCGELIDDNTNYCPFCRQAGSVKILSQTERDGFTGETIDAPVLNEKRQHNQHNNYYQNSGYSSGYGRNTKLYRFNLFPSSFLGKVLAVFIAGLLIFVALPIFFFMVLASVIAWFLFTRLK